MIKDWAPFDVSTGLSWETRAEAPRAITTREGVGDRLRAAAFAEIQARDAFFWAAENLPDASSDLRSVWKNLGHAEDRHFGWLLARMKELEIDPAGRKVSDHLWLSLTACKKAEDFAIFMANAEERGRKAGERFHQTLLETDLVSAEIFGKIAREEVQHIELAQRFFPEAWTKGGVGPFGPGTTEAQRPSFKPL